MINRKARVYVFVYTKGEVQSAQADGRSSVWILRTISTRELFQKGVIMMESVTVYGYVCIGLVGCALLGLIAFTYIALRRLRQVPHRWVYFVFRSAFVLKEYN
jgi:hypothetical protein